MNLPKFTASDIPLFNGIVSDLFPGVDLPPSDYDVMDAALKKASAFLGLQATENNLMKSIQLCETLFVRHGLMIVGLPPAGKTSVMNTLACAMEILFKKKQFLEDGGGGKGGNNGGKNGIGNENDDDIDIFLPVVKSILNPKSVPKTQLYGSFHEATHEWNDGVLAIAVRKASNEENQSKRQWIILGEIVMGFSQKKILKRLDYLLITK